MRRWIATAWWVGALACTPAPPEPVAPPPDTPDASSVHADLTARIDREINCDIGAYRVLCLAKAPPDGLPVPDVATAWMGLHFAVRRSRALDKGVDETLRLAQLVMSPEGARLTRMQLTESMTGVTYSRILRSVWDAAIGSGEAVEVPEGLFLELTTPSPVVDPVERDGDRIRLKADFPGTLWHVAAEGDRPPAWVAVEETPGGLLVSVYPEVSWTVP